MIQNNVVGQGIGIQCQVQTKDGKPDQKTNDLIEAAWYEWCEADNCHAAGRLNMTEMMRLIIGSVFQDGEILVRKIHEGFGRSDVPFCLEVIESDLLVDNECTMAPSQRGNTVRLGVEVNQWMRPQAYWFWPNHPGDINVSAYTQNQLFCVPATDIVHLYLVERWPQTRGTPWLHSVLKKLKDMGGYVNPKSWQQERQQILSALCSARLSTTAIWKTTGNRSRNISGASPECSSACSREKNSRGSRRLGPIQTSMRLCVTC